MDLNRDFLQKVENTLNMAYPNASTIPITLLGFGEISMVFSIVEDPSGNIAYKRLPIFQSEKQVKRHIGAFEKYNSYLTEAGILLPNQATAWVHSQDSKLQRSVGTKDIVKLTPKITLFCAQEIVNKECIGSHLIQTMTPEEISNFVKQILFEFNKIWLFNLSNKTVKLGFDGQISNFAVVNEKIIYLDTSTPMYRIKNKEAMDAELFLLSAPPGIRFLLKLFLLDSILDRYYDLRMVIIDLVANFIKENKGNLIPQLVQTVNKMLSDELAIHNVKPITIEEVKRYYRSDKHVWIIFQTLRRIHRFVTIKLLKRNYLFYLPPRIKR
jgi:hypothetical protein